MLDAREAATLADTGGCLGERCDRDRSDVRVDGRPSATCGYSASMKMHSPGHSSADSTTASSMPSGNVRETLGAARVGEDLVAFFDVGQTVVEQGEHGGRDLLAQAVTGAEILVDPDLHRRSSLFRSKSRMNVEGSRSIYHTAE